MNLFGAPNYILSLPSYVGCKSSKFRISHKKLVYSGIRRQDHKREYQELEGTKMEVRVGFFISNIKMEDDYITEEASGEGNNNA